MLAVQLHVQTRNDGILIRGHVTDTAGQPLRAITVYVFEDFDLDGHWERMDYSYYTSTDDSSDYGLELSDESHGSVDFHRQCARQRS